MADESKTEKATPKKRRDERKKGHTFFSKDAVSVATFFGSVFVLRLTFVGTVAALYAMFRTSFSYAANAAHYQSLATLRELLFQCVRTFLAVVAPLILTVAVVAICATFAQTKMLVAVEGMKPKFERINPLKGFKRLFSLKSVVEAAKGLLKITILMVLIYTCLKDLVSISPRYLDASIMEVCNHFFRAMFSMMLKVGLAFLVIAALDFVYQWWEYERGLRMSKQEIKEEYKQIEGDPQIKGKIRELQRKMAQSRMMQQVPQADVVIRNPTHFAVALRYKPGVDAAPFVLAKGQDSLAQRIIAIAEENKITVIENVPVARALYAQADLNAMIPPELYGAVAEVLVYLYKLDGRIQS